jgi:hypothetical protein
MKNRQSRAKNAGKPAALPKPAETPAQQQGQDKGRRSITLPADPAEQRLAVKDTYINVMGASVFGAQTRAYVSDDSGRVAETFIAAIRESVRPGDAIEEMLVVQMAWLHARVAKLSLLAMDQTQTNNVRVVNDACDRAANTFRRMMLALAAYRRPPQAAGFVAIRQANVANQQVVQNVDSQNPSPDFRKTVASNEQGSAPAALPPVAEGIELPAGDGAAKQAVAAQHRPQDGGGQARSKLNATKHGERSAKSRAAWRELNAVLRALGRYDRERANTLDGAAPARPDTPGATWVHRIADELRLSDHGA